jgi:hypothetical protein
MADDQETYPMPPHGWTCFHCGETFTTPGAARDHFGFEPSRDPGCRIKLGAERGLLMALRKAEQELSEAWRAIHSESTEAAIAYYAQQTRHRAQLMTVEEHGYERGLRDGLNKSEGPIIQALAKGSFIMTETHPSLKAPQGRKLVMGFANPDDADDAMQIISLALLDHRRALGSESRAEQSEARSEPEA